MSTPKSNSDALIIPTSATSQILTMNDFGQYDDNDTNTTDAETAIIITTLPQSGALQYKNGGVWKSVSANDTISVTDIDGGKLQFVPATASTDPSLTTLNDSLGFKVSNSSATSDAYKLNVYRADIDDDVAKLLNGLKTVYTVTPQSDDSIKIEVDNSANLSTLLGKTYPFSYLASGVLEKNSQSNYLILNSVDDSDGGFSAGYQLSKATVNDLSNAIFTVLSPISGNDSPLKGVIDKAKEDLAQADVNLIVSDDGSTLSLPLLGTHILYGDPTDPTKSNEFSIVLSGVSLALSTSSSASDNVKNLLETGNISGITGLLSTNVTDLSIGLGLNALFKLNGYDPTQETEPSLYAEGSVALDLSASDGVGFSVATTVSADGWDKPFGLKGVTFNELSLAYEQSITNLTSVTLGFLGDVELENKDLRLGAVLNTNPKEPDFSFSFGTKGDSVGLGTFFDVIADNMPAGASDIFDVLGKIYNNVSIQSIDSNPNDDVYPPLISFSAKGASIGSEEIEAGLHINAKANVAGLFSTTLVFDVKPLDVYAHAAFKIDIAKLGDVGIDFTIDKLSLSLNIDLPVIGNVHLSLNANDFDFSKIPKIIENQATKLIGHLADYVADAVMDGVTDIANAGKMVINEISAGANKAINKIKNFFGDHSNQYEPHTWLGTDGNDLKYDSKTDVYQWKGNDMLFGNDGDDHLGGDPGDDILDGGAGKDTLEGGADDDLLNGGDGNDSLNGGDGRDTVYGGNGNDTIINVSNDFVDGGAGDDKITNDKTTGAATIFGADGNDSITAGASDDVISGGAGNDAIDGGAGNDTIDYSLDSAMTVVLSETGTTTVTITTDDATTDVNESNIDTLSNIENITGSEFADSLTGNSKNNVLIGNDGNDSLTGNAGDDVIYGDDNLYEYNGHTYQLTKTSRTWDIAESEARANGAHLVTVDDSAENRFLFDTFGANGTRSLWIGLNDEKSSNNFQWADGKTSSYRNWNPSQPDNSDGKEYFAQIWGGRSGYWNDASATSEAQGVIEYDFIRSGNDVLDGGLGNDILNGGNGDDTLTGGEGNDVLVGGNGEDTAIFAGTLAQATIRYSSTSNAFTVTTTKDGIDSVYSNVETFKFDDQSISVSLTIPSSDFDSAFYLARYTDLRNAFGTDKTQAFNHFIASGYKEHRVVFNTGDDNLIGSTSNDSLNAGDGNDTLNGGLGNDTLNGGDGNDIVDYSTVTGAGLTIDLNNASATFSSNAGTDTLVNVEGLIGTQFNDEFKGDSNNNIFVGNSGNDSLYGDSGHDTLDGGAGNDYMQGNDGSDSLIGGDGNDAMDGGNNEDTLNGGAGNDSINGVDQNDSINGGDGNDSLRGGNGNDTIMGGSGNDTIDGEDGDDTLDYSNESQKVTASLSSSTVTLSANNVDTIKNMDNLTGSAFSDSLTGASNNNVLTGGDGNDRLNGASGNDSLIGGAGDDYLIGGDGSGDVAIFPGAKADGVIHYLPSLNIFTVSTADGGTDTVSDDIETIKFADSSNSASSIFTYSSISDDFDAEFYLAKYSDLRTAFGTNTTSAFQHFRDSGYEEGRTVSSEGANNLKGSTSRDILNGGNGNDTVYGYAGNDILSGGAGNDSLSGGDGEDRLSGGEGNDSLYGDNGGDTVDYSAVTGGGIKVVYSATWKATSTPSTGSNAGTDILNNIENLIGTSFDDSFTADSNNNILTGGSGNDTIDGGAGNDVIYGDGQYEYNGHTYKLTTVYGSWTQAEAEAKLSGGHLATIDDEAENSFIFNTFGANDTRNLWIGLNDAASENSFVWADGSTSSYRNWKSGQPDDAGSNEDYAHLWAGSAGLWNDASGTTYGVIEYNSNGGADSLVGGTGDDTLNGGDGNDTLKGGTGNDIFKFTLDSDTTKTSDDVITDFSYSSGNQDKIDLSSIDADLSKIGDQAFSIVTSSTFTAAGQLRFDNATKMLYGNVDSDTDAEFSVLLTGVTSVNTAYFAL